MSLKPNHVEFQNEIDSILKKDDKLKELWDISLSKKGQTCRINPKAIVKVTNRGRQVSTKTEKDGTIEFATKPGERYKLTR